MQPDPTSERTDEPGEEPDPRFTLANERTFLAWNRTALALLGAGLLVAQFLTDWSRLERLLLAVPLTLFGAAIAYASLRRWKAAQRALRMRAPLPPSRLPEILTIGTTGVAIAVLIVVLVR